MGVNPNTPNWKIPFLDGSGTISQTWFAYLAQLGGFSPGAITSVIAAASPFTYTASAHGNLAISGGTVSSITLARAHVAGVNLGVTSGQITLSAGDKVTITYSAVPTINFIPS